ncbi:MAG TPA: MFS transporter [Candidatus Limnocylindria bacterium]|jgi:MFS family permease|nr:MFS transporter [Candidatus Limnocylindria bacterium]
MRLRPYLTLLRGNSAFTRLFAAQLVSFAGDWFATVALLGLALELTGSPGVASLLLVVQTGAFALASPLAGVLADRYDRRRLMVLADVARVPVALAFLLARDPDTLWIAFVAAAVLSLGAAVFEPSSSASLPNLVGEGELAEANVLIGSAWGTMLAVGAALGGLVAATLGRDVAFAINAASFAASALLILGIRRSFRAPREEATAGSPQPERGGIGESIRVVLRFARGNRTLAALLLSKTTFGVGTGVIVLLAVFGRDVFHAGDAGIGILFAARGLGALLGPFLVRSIVGVSERGLIGGIAASFGIFAVSYGLLPLAPILPLAAVAVFAAHLGGGAQWTLSSYGLQRAAPDAIRGRVFSFDYGLVTLTITFSTLVAGFLAERSSPAATTWTMVGLAAVAAIGWIAFARPVWRRTGG